MSCQVPSSWFTQGPGREGVQDRWTYCISCHVLSVDSYPLYIHRHFPREQFLYLHGHREVVLGFWRKENIHSFLWKWLIPSRWSPNFNDVQLEAKQKGTKQTDVGQSVPNMSLISTLSESMIS